MRRTGLGAACLSQRELLAPACKTRTEPGRRPKDVMRAAKCSDSCQTESRQCRRQSCVTSVTCPLSTAATHLAAMSSTDEPEFDPTQSSTLVNYLRVMNHVVQVLPTAGLPCSLGGSTHILVPPATQVALLLTTTAIVPLSFAHHVCRKASRPAGWLAWQPLSQLLLTGSTRR